MTQAAHPFGQLQRFKIPGGDRGVEITVRAMREIAREAALESERVHQLAIRLAAMSSNRDRRAQLVTLWRFLRTGVNFKPDTFDAEHLRIPDQLLDEIAAHGRTSADCDDVAMLAASIIMALGMRAGVAVVGRGRRFEHVFAVADLGDGRPFTLDPQERIPPGKWPAGISRRRVFWFA